MYIYIYVFTNVYIDIYIYIYGGSINGGTSNGWFIMENTNQKWMMIWGYPSFRKPPHAFPPVKES